MLLQVWVKSQQFNDLKIKEALNIISEKPRLNTQVKHLNIVTKLSSNRPIFISSLLLLLLHCLASLKYYAGFSHLL